MSHEHVHVRVEVCFQFPAQIPWHPLGAVGVRGRHSVAEDGVEEGLPLSGVQSEHVEDPFEVLHQERERGLEGTGLAFPDPS